MKKSATFIEGPEIGGVIALRLKDEELAIGRRLAAALIRRRVPARKQGLQISAVRRSLPNRTIVGVGIVHGKAQNRAVARPAKIAGSSCSGQEQARIVAIVPRYEDFVLFAEGKSQSIRRPRARVAFQIAQAPRRTANHWNAPEGAVERSAVGGIHQKQGAIRRNVAN